MAGKDITGRVSGRLTAIRRLDKKRGDVYLWLCRCECGKTKMVTVSDIGQKKVKSCGCLKAEKMDPDSEWGKRRQAIRKLHAKRVAVKAIARDLGVSRQRIYEILREYRGVEE